ncbi:prolyl 4-hydroxylase subunit alpha-2-like [Ornithodoros turicata]|uniref:prolyl 4-hydroxylase subunit alpha-2-like n=1 Tax=Ornithodoros turicata TaxID=34597 RepID=UPI003139E3E6
MAILQGKKKRRLNILLTLLASGYLCVFLDSFNMKYTFVTLFLSCFFADRGTAERYSAITDLVPLLATDNAIAIVVRRYINEESARIARLESYDVELARLDCNSTVVTDFLIVSRLSLAWVRTINLTTQETKVNAEGLLIDSSLAMPTIEDLDGSSTGLCRLIETYKLTVKQMTHLRTAGVREPTASDLIEVAEGCYAEGDLKNAALWFREALQVYDRSKDLMGLVIRRQDIVKDLAEALHTTGDVYMALEVVKEQLSVTPNNEDLQKMRHKYATERQKVNHTAAINDSFHNLCLQDDPQGSTKLYCKTTTNGGQAWLLLQPLKMEVVSVEPRIVVFHEFLSREECRTLRDLARPTLTRATVFTPTGHANSSDRIGKVSWFRDDADTVIQRTNRRISSATGLSLISAELFQIVNYGIGGHYVPHYDFTRERDMGCQCREEGERLATFLIYISKVTAGGATVFTGPRVAVRPQEGKAVFWYNLIPSSVNVTDIAAFGEARIGDVRLKHGACPVLEGSKWIATKWIRERAQGQVSYDSPK